ncbi:ScbA/BarX family gamma-butyrolactone biosynthesis protein [Streptomyces seoulensis]
MLTTTAPLDAVRQPVLTTTVAREYVHRAALSEVFLTGWSKGGPDSFTVTAQWPRSHSFYNSEHGLYDPLLLSETVRQCGLLLMHVGYHMPFGHQISWSRLQYTLDPRALRIEATPAEIELHVTCSDVKYQGKVARTMVVHLEAVRAGSLLARATIGFNSHSPAVYRRLRAGRNVEEIFAAVPEPPEPVSRAAAGRLRRQDIVLSPTERSARWQLRVDTSHPVLFDHPVDHVPGMLLLEAVRQAGQATDPAQAGAVLPVSLDVSFNRYVEFDQPCWIEAEQIRTASSSSGIRRVMKVDARQNGFSAFTATTELADAATV